jgi:glycosyl transferase family 87
VPAYHSPEGCLLTVAHPYLSDLFERIRRRGPFKKAEIALFAIGLSAAYVFGIRWNHGMADFAVNYRAGQRILRGETLYQTADGHYMFKYFPSAALIYAPFTALPIELAMAVWFLLSLGAFIANFRIIDRLVTQKRLAYSLAIAGAILAKYILHELRLGQINVFVMLLMLASLEALLGAPAWQAELIGGALAGIAVAIKPYAALLVLYLVVTLRWRSVAAALAALGICLLLPSALYGVAGNLGELREWASTLSGSTPALLTNVDNVSVLAFFSKWLDPARAVPPTMVVLGTLAVLTMAIIVMGWRRRDSCVLDGALILTLIPLISPLGWDYNFMLALLAVTLIVNSRLAFSTPIRWLLAANFAVIALALYDTMGRAAYGAFMRWSVTTINFGIVILALAYLRFRKVC